MHLAPDPVSDVLADHPITVRFRRRLDRVTDVAEAVARPRHTQPIPQRFFGDHQKSPYLIRNLADRHREGRITVPSLVDGASVDRDDVSVAQGVAVRDAVDDCGIGRGTDRRGEPVVAEERWPAAAFADDLRSDRIELPRRDAGNRGFPYGLVHRRNTLPGDLHLCEVIRLLLRDDLRSCHQDASSQAIRQKMSSTEPVPSTRRTRSP